VEQHSHGAGVPLQIRSERPKSTSVADFDPITIRDEQWRYLPVERLKGLEEDALTEYLGDLQFDGPKAITTAWIKKDHPLFGAAGVPEDRTSAASWESTEAAYLITVPEGTDEPAVLTVNSSDFTPSALHVVIESKLHAKGTVVIDHRGKGVLAENIEILVGDESDLTVISIQDWSAGSVHTSAQFAKLGRNSHLKHVVVSFGGDTVRVTPSVYFDGPGAAVDLFGVYFADADQHLEHRPFVDHSKPNCTSRVTYKGALQGDKAHTVWVGDVLIRKEAEGTDTYELNRNLLLTDGARADSVPNLEIETGQIEGAGHASASGRFDDEHLFYLQARGINELEARRLVVKGFLNEIVQQIGIDSIEERLNKSIEEELKRSVN
jgi:Fe-S cluster assembly protein SufD